MVDDFDNPLMKHVAVFKIFLDKIYNGKEGDMPNNREARPAEREESLDGLLDQITSLTSKDMETILSLEKRLKDRASELALLVSFSSTFLTDFRARRKSTTT